MKEKFRQPANGQQIVAQVRERKRLDMMAKLKSSGGPFTRAEQVEAYLKTVVEINAKQQGMKMELQFARDSSTTLPKVDPIFRVQVTMLNQKRGDKSAEEFGKGLVAFLVKKKEKAILEYDRFVSSLEKMLNGCLG